MNIVFGTIKKAVRDAASNEKYPEMPVVTVEEVKGENKSRRILFNSKAMEVLDIPAGVQQNLIFGFVETDDNGNRKVLVANAELLPGKENTVVYSVSKNKVAYEGTKEKGKAVASQRIHGEITSFLEVDNTIAHEYQLVYFGENSGLKLYEFSKINLENDGKSLNDLIENPLSYTGYNQNELNDASLDIEDYPTKEELSGISQETDEVLENSSLIEQEFEEVTTKEDFSDFSDAIN